MADIDRSGLQQQALVSTGRAMTGVPKYAGKSATRVRCDRRCGCPGAERRSSWSAAVRSSCTRPQAPGGRVNRYYDPSTAQFVSVDPAVATTGAPYYYAEDDPVNGTDPSGLRPVGKALVVLLPKATGSINWFELFETLEFGADAAATYVLGATVISASFVLEPPSFGLSTLGVIGGSVIIAGSGVLAAIAAKAASNIFSHPGNSKAVSTSRSTTLSGYSILGNGTSSSSSSGSC